METDPIVPSAKRRVDKDRRQRVIYSCLVAASIRTANLGAPRFSFAKHIWLRFE